MELSKKLRNPINVLSTVMFITNIGNGMYTLAVSMVMYKLTGSTGAFAGIIILENILNFLVQIFASVAVDEGRAKQCAFWADTIRGLFIIIGGIFVINGFPYAIYLGVIAINIMRPFYRTSMFAIGPLIAKGEELAKYAARNSVAQQAGQLVGAGIAGVLITIFNPGMCIIINGLTYLFSAFCMFYISIPGQKVFYKKEGFRGSNLKLANPINIYHEWMELIFNLVKNIKLFLFIIVCTIDFLVISYINMSYAPVLEKMNADGWWISVWDSLFAIGAILGAIIFSKWKLIRESEIIMGLILIVEGFFTLTFLLNTPEIVTVGMLGLGIINAVSVSNFSYYLQTKSEGSLHGRIAGLRQFMISLSSIILVPLLSHELDKKSIGASLSMILICILGAIIIFMSVYFLSRSSKKESVEEI